MAKSGDTRHGRQHAGAGNGDATRRRANTSNNLAKLPLEFSSTIERERLKVSYGEGFGGAPLRLFPATHGVTTGAGERRDEQAKEQGGKIFGGDDHV